MIRQPRTVLAVLTAGCIAVAAVAGEQNPADRFAGVELTVVPVAGQVHMVQRPGGGGNVGVFAGPDGVLLVDSLFAPLAERLVAAVRTVSDGEIRFLINTHVHPDHIGGNEPLAERDVLIFAHDNVRVRALERLRFPRRGGSFAPRPTAGARPVVTYNDAVSFHFNGEEVRAFLAPAAHTDGDTFVHFPGSDVLHLGDVFRTTSYPIVDVYNGGTVAGTIAALEKAIGMAGPRTRVIPGHGPGGRGTRRARRVPRHDRRYSRSRARDDRRGLHPGGRDERGADGRLRRAVGPGSDVDRERLRADRVPRAGRRVALRALNDFVPIVFHELGGGSLYVR